MKAKTETTNSLQFSYLPNYAQYLLTHKLEAFVWKQLEIGKQLNIPLLKVLNHISEEELVDYSKKHSAAYLTYLANNDAASQIHEAIKQWKTNSLPDIDKYQIVAEDISLISYMRKKTFLHFLPEYCRDPEQMILIIEEIDYFLSRNDITSTDTFISLLSERIEQHSHFIEKINATSPSAIYVFDILEQKIVYTNGKFNEMLGIDPEARSLLDLDIFETLVHPEHLEESRAYFTSVKNIADKEVRSFKYRIKDKIGEYRWVRSYDTVFKRNENGSVSQIIGVAIDVNKEKTVSDELRKREKQLTEAQALAHLGSWSWDFQKGTIQWSDEMYRIYNLDKAETELNYDFIFKFNHPEDREHVVLQLQKAIDEKKSIEFRYRVLVDGSIKHISTTVEVIVDSADNILELFGVAQDITEREILLEQLRKSEFLYRHAESLANIGNWFWDLKTQKLQWTDQLYRIYGMEPQSETITIEGFLSFVHPEDKLSVEKMISIESATDFVDQTFRIITRQGIVKTLRSIAQNQRDAQGKIISVLGTEQDITERQQLLENLQRSESLYKQAQAIAKLGSWRLNLSTNETFWTEELRSIYEITDVESMHFNEWSNFIHPDDKEWVLNYSNERLIDKKPYELKHRILLRNGKVKTIHRRAEFLLDDDGNIVDVYGVTQDITDQVTVENELRENQTFIQTIADATPAIISSYKVLTGKYTFISGGLKRLLGYEVNEAMDDSMDFFMSIVHPDDAEKLFADNMSALAAANNNSTATNTIAEFTYRMRHKNGIYHWFTTYASVFTRTATGNVESVLKITLDITDHISATKKIKEQEHFIEQVADASPTILYLFDIGPNQFSYINHEIYYVLGYTPEEIIAMDNMATDLLYHPEDYPLLPERRQTSKKFQHTNSMMQYECRLKNKVGDWCWVLVREVIFKRDEEGQPVQILGAALDITKRKEMEKSLLQNAFQLEQSNASLEEFAYVASHDLKEPLRKISTFGDRILQTQEERLSDDGKVYLKKIIDASHRMQIMINDLLSISMITGDQSFEPFSLQNILEEVKQTLEYKVENKNAIIEGNDLPEANVIPSQFRQLFQNLLSNSLKFTRNDVQPHITIKSTYLLPEEIEDLQLTKAPRYLKLEFIDNGIGFEEEYTSKIFQIFQRLHGRSEYEGTGIGLAICKKIIEHHSGIIYAKGQPGEGATFTIILPS